MGTRLYVCTIGKYKLWNAIIKRHYYREKFGIHYVNFSDPALPRTAKESSRFLAQIIADNGFVEENMP